MIEQTFTLYKHAGDTQGASGTTLTYILSLIKTGDKGIKDKIATLRQLLIEGKQSDYVELKRTLPLFTPAGNFWYRNGNPNNLKDYSSVLCLDFDFDDSSKILPYKQYLISNASKLHLVAVWLSPGHGVKALMLHDNQDPVLHYNLFWSVKKNIFPEADPNCSDICRGCYLSFDPDIFINEAPDIKPYHFVYDDTVPAPKVHAPRESSGPSQPFTHSPEEIAKNTEWQKVCPDKTLMNKLVKIFNATDPEYYMDGHRHKEIKRRAVFYCKDGVLYDNALWSLQGLFGPFSKAGFSDAEIESMVSACYRNAIGEFGTMRAEFVKNNCITLNFPFSIKK